MLRSIQIPKFGWLSLEIVFLPHNMNQSKNTCSARVREAAEYKTEKERKEKQG
jgi:hypothetical protein